MQEKSATYKGNENEGWYAARVFYNRYQPLVKELEIGGVEYFVPGDAVPGLLFIRTREGYVAEFGREHYGQMWVYHLPGTRRPALIGDEEMELFRFVVTAGREGLTYLGDDRPEYHQGDRVRVTDGPFKGAEGYIRRIKHDRRLVVSIRGVVAVATTFIHPRFLERIEE